MNTRDRHPDVLLVTGCIRPVEGQAYLKLTDVGERLSQYRESLADYLENTGFQRVIFCENSGFPLEFTDLERLAKERGKELEALSFLGNADETRRRGKGYGEGEIVAHALACSRWADEITQFVKVTGRLVVRNLEVIRRRLNPKRFYINRLLIRNKAEELDTRLYAISAELYKRQFLDLYKGVMVEWPLEKAFMRCTQENGIAYHCFPRYPEFSGSCGGDGMIYGKESARFLWSLRFASACGVFNRNWFATGLSRWRARGQPCAGKREKHV